MTAPYVRGLVNGTILTMDERNSTAEAIAWEGNRIIALGKTTEIKALLEARGGEVVDLAGATVLPGFTDAHLHMMAMGVNASAIDLYDSGSVQVILEQIRERARQLPPGQWIHGRLLDESRLKEKRPPTLAELDQAAPDHPVFLLDRGMHFQVVNSRGWERLGLDDDTPGLQVQNGVFTGRIQQLGRGRARQAFYESLDVSIREEAIREVARVAASVGATSVHAIDGGPLFADSDVEIIQRLQADLPTRVVLFWNTPEVSRVVESDIKRVGGCILLDGAIGSRTACFDEPYADDPSTRGRLNFSDQQVLEMMTTAHLGGLQMSFHTIGESAVRQGLDCYAELFRRYPEAAGGRHRLEHFGFPKPEDITRAAELGIIISTQPSFAYLRGGPGGVYETRLGPERVRRGYPMRELLEKGAIIAGGSDADASPLDPLLGIHSAVNHPYPEQRLTAAEAVRLFTVNGPFSIGAERELGSLTPGRLADLVILDANPLTADPKGLKNIKVLQTYKDGELVYRHID